MKIRTLITVLFVALAMNSFAQDESACRANSSIAREAVKVGNFKDAYKPWRAVLDECPLLRFYTFTDGFKILKGFLDENQDRKSESYVKYFNELMEVHDLRMKYTPQFIEKGVKVASVEEALGIKAIDYIAYTPNIDVNLVYGWLKESVTAIKGESAAAVLHYFVEMSMNKLKADNAHSEQFIQDFLDASQYADMAIEGATKDNVKNVYKGVKENLVALFVNSGAADCESLQNIYGPKVEENKANLAYLKKVVEVMKIMKCTEQEAYFKASYYAYQIEPTADAASGCAFMAYKKGDIDAAVKFFDEALELEQNPTARAEKAYATAVMLANSKRLSQARNYARKAISFNGNYGAPYILIATLYGSNPNWSDETALNKCTYFVVLDLLQKAKSVDPSVTEEANKLIGTYSKYVPEANDLFMLGYTAGDRITVGGWIGETTTIR